VSARERGRDAGASELAELLGVAREAARVAAEAILPIYRGDFAVEIKADSTPVTEADRRAEEAMRALFARETPSFGVVGEEFGASAGDGRHRWIVDPIDGTKSFVHRVPLWGTLVALERDGVPVIGVVSCPATGERVEAATGLGARDQDGRSVRVSAVRSLRESAVSTSSVAALSADYPAAFARLLGGARLLRTWGDCYGYLLVATGRIEAMLDPRMNLWDVAALHPIVEESGGRITTWEGERRVGASAIATNGLVHDEVLAVLRSPA
jgi:histidinol phosphatase-like enzyme (inositol monophosphatase family)